MTGRPNGRKCRWRAAGRALRALCLPAALVAAGTVPAAPATASVLPAAPVAGAPAHPVPALGDLTTYGYDNARSDDDTVGPAISKLSAAPAWDDALDAGVYGQPLVYYGTVYVGTEDDTIYAIDAKRGKVTWKVQVGTPVSTAVVDSTPTLDGGCGNIDPLGITGTPVIDPGTNEIFAAEETEVGGHRWQDVRHWLVAVSLVSHQELWHRQIDPPYGNQAGHYYIPAEQQRPALTLLGGRIYVEFGGLIGDCGQYHGYVVSLAAAGAAPLASYQVPTQREGAIWGTGGAFVSSAGDLYVSTGNGSSSSVSTYDEGNSVVELSPGLARLGYWAPSNWVALNDNDWDLGSAGPIAVPGTSLLFVAGKPAANGSFGYLMGTSHLEGIGKGAFTGALCLGGGAFGAYATDVIGTGARSRTYVYAPCGNGTVAVEVDASAMTFERVWSASTGSPDGPPVVAGGLVWAVNWGSGGLFGMNPSTGHVVMKRSTDALEHFATPAAGDGTLLVPTQNGVEAWAASS